MRMSKFGKFVIINALEGLLTGAIGPGKDFRHCVGGFGDTVLCFLGL